MSAETERNLNDALTAHLTAEGLLEQGDFVGDWITSIYLPSVEANDGYALVVSGGSLPDHTATGLLIKALDRVRYSRDDDDD